MSNLKLFFDFRIGPAFAPKVPRVGPQMPLEKVLQLARDEVLGWGGELYFVYVPSYADLKYRNRPNAARVAGLSAAEAARIPIVDLLPLFSDPSAPLDDFAYTYSHYNERGYRQAAQGILAALQNAPAR